MMQSINNVEDLLRSAKYNWSIVSEHPSSVNVVCSELQQAAESCIKAALKMKGIKTNKSPYNIHDIRLLLNNIPEYGNALWYQTLTSNANLITGWRKSGQYSFDCMLDETTFLVISGAISDMCSDLRNNVTYSVDISSNIRSILNSMNCSYKVEDVIGLIPNVPDMPHEELYESVKAAVKFLSNK